MNNLDIAKAYIKAMQTGDQATLGTIISPDVIWHQPGNNQFSGTHRSMVSVGPMPGKMMDVSRGTLAITRADHYMANGDWVAITLEFAGEANGNKLKQAADEQRVVGIYRWSVMFASGRYAMLDDGKGVSLVPWRPVTEQRLGPQIAATVRGSSVSGDVAR
ncbi:nuclear transport factor 2 family protein [Dickeya chrysanthemi]|uniref:DUF3363 domain-containing protein n=1 Tax=Dickeya chrysanthemi TaxID=556 RepID=A0ABU8JKD5_DICCH